MLFVSGCDAAEVFDAIEEALDTVPFSIEQDNSKSVVFGPDAASMMR